MNSKVYYDSDYEGNFYPLWYTIEGLIDWEQSNFYFPVSAPFERIDSISFDDGIIGCSVLAQELLVRPDKPNQLGINLDAVKTRASERIEPEQIERLIIQLSDMEELLHMGKEMFEWR
ncbi:hypothetical protein NIE88_18585 [Sporolactobacillus shoreicorticis]|uniref:Uncharacterized protein n=1 Tax=Sporolactobacillus shoreicorticis TaxID=1923877 RepID=A0ABW5S6B9_9BACL|nr:hypothetical protein [Sporolactobacillus shoreicorticis]MCO7127756.1 hypothetical protein [Sporolactobacillus shoreicorticis]